jgi:hypothetical protein
VKEGDEDRSLRLADAPAVQRGLAVFADQRWQGLIGEREILFGSQQYARRYLGRGNRNRAKVPPCVTYAQKSLIRRALIHTLE